MCVSVCGVCMLCLCVCYMVCLWSMCDVGGVGMWYICEYKSMVYMMCVQGFVLYVCLSTCVCVCMVYGGCMGL